MAASGADVVSLDWTVSIPEVVYIAKSAVEHLSLSQILRQILLTLL